MTLEQFKSVLSGYQEIVDKTDTIYKTTGLDFLSLDVWKLWEDLFDTTLQLTFGPRVMDEIWRWLLKDNTKFETVEELYEFCSDAYAEWVGKTPLPLTELRKKFPKEKMLEVFEEVVKSVNNANVNS